MLERYESTVERHLADLLFDSLRRATIAAGFEEVLRLHEPDVTEFRRLNEVLSLSREDSGHQRHRLVLEGESTDVQPIAGEAARLVLLDVARQLLLAMPWVDRAALEQDIDQVLQEGLARPESTD